MTMAATTTRQRPTLHVKLTSNRNKHQFPDGVKSFMIRWFRWKPPTLSLYWFLPRKILRCQKKRVFFSEVLFTFIEVSLTLVRPTPSTAHFCWLITPSLRAFDAVSFNLQNTIENGGVSAVRQASRIAQDPCPCRKEKPKLLKTQMVLEGRRGGGE